jgi:serine/threonine protein kinase
MSLLKGKRLGRYEIHSLLGAGGMGEVYLAHDTQLKRRVALL